MNQEPRTKNRVGAMGVGTSLALEEQVIGVDWGAWPRGRARGWVAEEDEEGGLPIGREIEGQSHGLLAEEGCALEVAGKAAGVGGQKEVLEGGAEALDEHVALSEAAASVGPGTGVGER